MPEATAIDDPSSVTRPWASFVIPTRQRVDELRQLLISLTAQSVPIEVHVMDDGEDDESGRMIQREFSQVHYHRMAAGRGPAFQRNRGIELATANIVFPVDDDTVFISPRTVEQTLAEFNHPRVAAVAVPFLNINQDNVVRQRSPDKEAIYVVEAFIGAAHAVRRDVFLALRGYREHLFYMGEEGDLCLRMLQAGYVTRLGSADPIHHMESPRRNVNRMDYYGPRNSVLFQWQNAPCGLAPFAMMATTYNCLCWSFNPRRLAVRLKGICAGYRDCGRVSRRPVHARIFRLWRRLKKEGAVPLTEIVHQLPDLL